MPERGEKGFRMCAFCFQALAEGESHVQKTRSADRAGTTLLASCQPVEAREAFARASFMAVPESETRGLPDFDSAANAVDDAKARRG